MSIICREVLDLLKYNFFFILVEKISENLALLA